MQLYSAFHNQLKIKFVCGKIILNGLVIVVFVQINLLTELIDINKEFLIFNAVLVLVKRRS